MKRRRFVTLLTLFVIAGVALALLVLAVFFKQNVILSAVITLIFIALLLVIFYSLDLMRNESNHEIEEALESAYKEVLNHGDIGILAYDANYEITFMSDFFLKRNMNHLGEKLLNWLPELQDMLNNESSNETLAVNEETFSVRKVENAYLLTFKNISEVYGLNRKLQDEALVIGLLSYDNYDEVNMSDDELSYINTNIKVPVIDYFKKFNVVYKTLKNNRLLLILNEKIFEEIRADRFSILNTVRKVSKEGNTDVTISLAFARGYESYQDLDVSAAKLLELAQTRGGDQVVVKKGNEDATFYGGTSEAREKQSKTRVRVTANEIKDLLDRSVNVIIAGHRDMDADCIGSALGLANIALSCKKPAYIVTRSGGIEPMIAEVMKLYSKNLESKFNLISENEALDLLEDDSLVIMTDHHSASQSNCANLLKQAQRIIIIDHHRRKADLDVTAMMLYIEAAASSATELVVELLPYFARNIGITPQEANIMYLGMLIDTDHFRVRTGSRTFDAAKQLRGMGADPMVCDELSQESFENVARRSQLINAARPYRKDVIISSVEEGSFSRTIVSQACDVMVKAKEIEAAFVICHSDRDEAIISARSKGHINVQVIMEQMHGGGHMTAAGLQVPDGSISELKQQLEAILDDYFKGGDLENESNSVK